MEANETRNAGRRGVHNGGGKAGLKKQSIIKEDKFVKGTICYEWEMLAGEGGKAGLKK